MYNPIFYANCSLVQANLRYMIFTNTGECIAKGETKDYIDQRAAEELIREALIDMVATKGGTKE